MENAVPVHPAIPSKKASVKSIPRPSMNGTPLIMAQKNQKRATEQRAVERRTPRSLRGMLRKSDPEKKKDHGNRRHGEEHVPFRKEHGNDERDAGNRGDKDENIPEIGNDRGKVDEPPHHYRVTARTLLVFAHDEGQQQRRSASPPFCILKVLSDLIRNPQSNWRRHPRQRSSTCFRNEDPDKREF